MRKSESGVITPLTASDRNASDSKDRTKVANIWKCALYNNEEKWGRTPLVGVFNSLPRRRRVSSPFPAQTNNGNVSREALPRRPVSYNGNSNHHQQIVQTATNSHGGYSDAVPSTQPPLNPPQPEDAIHNTTGIYTGVNPQIGSQTATECVEAHDATQHLASIDLQYDPDLLKELNEVFGPLSLPYDFDVLDCASLFDGDRSQRTEDAKQCPTQQHFHIPLQHEAPRTTHNETPPTPTQHQERKLARSSNSFNGTAPPKGPGSSQKLSLEAAGSNIPSSDFQQEPKTVDQALSKTGKEQPGTTASAGDMAASSRSSQVNLKSVFDSKVNLVENEARPHLLGNYFGQTFWSFGEQSQKLVSILQQVMEMSFPEAMNLLAKRFPIKYNMDLFRDKALTWLGWTKKNREAFLAKTASGSSDFEALWNNLPFQMLDWIKGALLTHMKTLYGDPANWREEVTADEAIVAREAAFMIIGTQLDERRIAISKELEKRGPPCVLWSWSDSPLIPQNSTSLKRCREEDEDPSQTEEAPERKRPRKLLKRPSPLRQVSSITDFNPADKEEKEDPKHIGWPSHLATTPSTRSSRKKTQPHQAWEPCISDYPELPSLGALTPASIKTTDQAPTKSLRGTLAFDPYPYPPQDTPALNTVRVDISKSKWHRSSIPLKIARSLSWVRTTKKVKKCAADYF